MRLKSVVKNDVKSIIDRLNDELLRLGFRGDGKLKVDKFLITNKVEFYYERRGRSVMHQLKEGGCMRMRSYPLIGLKIIYDSKVNSYTWSYVSKDQIEFSRSLLLEGKLAMLLGDSGLES